MEVVARPFYTSKTMFGRFNSFECDPFLAPTTVNLERIAYKQLDKNSMSNGTCNPNDADFGRFF